jgi:hypothetical protein
MQTEPCLQISLGHAPLPDRVCAPRTRVHGPFGLEWRGAGAFRELPRHDESSYRPLYIMSPMPPIPPGMPAAAVAFSG